MFTRPLLTISALSLLLWPVAVSAQKTSSDPEIPEALQTLVDRGAQTRYLGTKHGMQGWITVFKGQEQYYYVTPDGNGFLMGLLFSKDGTMETVNQVRALQNSSDDALDILAVDKTPAEQARETASKTNEQFEYKTPAERMFVDVENSNWLQFGADTAPVLYSFMDPQCPHCHAFMEEIKPTYIDKGLIQVRMIPVGFREETLNQAALLLAASDSQERFFNHIKGDKAALPVDDSINTQGVQKNLSLMQAWKFDVTPLTIYRDKAGKVKIIRGKAADMNQILSDLPSS